MQQETCLAHAGGVGDSFAGTVSVPIYQSATFRHPGLGESTGFDYSRTVNPTRSALEKTLAALDGGARACACAFASGMAAVSSVLMLFRPGDHLIVRRAGVGGGFVAGHSTGSEKSEITK